MSKKLIKCFSAQATGAFGIEPDDLMVVERPLRGQIVARKAYNGHLTGLPEYLLDTAIEVNTQGKAAELLISRDRSGRTHHLLVPTSHSLGG